MQLRQRNSASSRVAFTLVLSTAATAAIAGEQPAQEGQRADEPVVVSPVIVTAPRGSLRGAVADRTVSAGSIPSYGVGTIGELVDELAAENGENAPVVILNGERIDDYSGVSDLPVEAVERVDILPRGAGARVGASPRGRVINVVLRREVRISVADGGYRVATEGGFSEASGEVTRTRIKGPNRYNIALRVGREDELLESERGIIQPTRTNTYGISGTVVPDPLTTGFEIDPALSAAAGRPVARAAITPTAGRPPLSAFVATAGAADEPALGQFRTLRPHRATNRLSISAVQRLASWLTGSINARLNHSESTSLNGIAAGLFSLPAENAFTPFSRPVGITAARREALQSRQESSTFSVSGILTAAYEDWKFSLLAGVSHSDRSFLTEQQSTAQQVATPVQIRDPTYNPFTGGLGDLVVIGTAETFSLTQASTVQVTASGSPVELPAGPLQLTLNGRIDYTTLESLSSSGGAALDRDFARTARNASVIIAIPLASRREGFLSAAGEIYGNLEFGVEHVEQVGTSTRYSAGLDWEPTDRLRLSTRIDEVVTSPDAESLADPIVLTPGVRYFDFLTGTTAEVTQTTGGNPLLRPQSEKSRRYGANVELWRRINLNFATEYLATQTTDLISSLPPASAAVLLAFPERFVRGADGALSNVDVRPINFDRQTQEQLRSGFSFNMPLEWLFSRRLAGTPVLGTDGPPPRLQVAANHTVVFASDIVIRPGLPGVDLLNGGAIGISGGQPRHRTDFSIALTATGFGVRATGVYQGPSTLELRQGDAVGFLQFDSLSTINLTAFAEAHRFLPRIQFLKGVQITFSVLNLANSRQRVTDPLGQTPLNFQPAYRDAIGRTVELSLRRAF